MCVSYVVCVLSRLICVYICDIFVFKQKTAYELRISDWSSDVCSSDLEGVAQLQIALPIRQHTGKCALGKDRRDLTTEAGAIAMTKSCGKPRLFIVQGATRHPLGKPRQGQVLATTRPFRCNRTVGVRRAELQAEAGQCVAEQVAGQCGAELAAPQPTGGTVGRTTDGADVGHRLNRVVGIDEAGKVERQGLVENRSEEQTSELQSLMRISYAVLCLKKKN